MAKFARISNPSYSNLIRRFYANLTRPHKNQLDMFSTFGDIEIELDPSIMCRILGLLDEGNEVYDSNNWPILSNFDAQEALKGLCKANSWHPKPNQKILLSKLGFYSSLYNIISFPMVGIGVSYLI